MGASESEPNGVSNEKDKNKLTLLMQTQGELGTIDVMQDQLNNKYCQIKYVFENKSQYNQAKTAVEQLKIIDRQQAFIFPYSYNFVDNTYNCSNSQAVISFYYFIGTIQDMLRESYQNKFFKDESDYWKLFFSITKVIIYSREHELPGGFIHSASICY